MEIMKRNKPENGIKRYFGSLSFYKQALMIGVPVMLQSLIQSLVSLVDNFMVAGLGAGVDVRRVEADGLCQDHRSPPVAEEGEVGEEPDGAGGVRPRQRGKGSIPWTSIGLI